MADREIEFLESGHSPDIGVFDAGLRRKVPEELAEVFIGRGLAVGLSEIKPAKKTAVAAAKENDDE